MGRSKTLSVFLFFVVVLLIGLNLYQFWISYDSGETVKKEDVPVQIASLKGDEWRSIIGETVSVEGYYVQNNGIAMLLSDPGLIGSRRPLNTSEYIRIDVPLPDDAKWMGQYLIKGKVIESSDIDEKVYLGKDEYHLQLAPVTKPPIVMPDISIVVPPEHAETKYAVLISGGWTPQDAWPSFWNDLKFVYSVLVQKYHYDPANIYVLYNDGKAPDGQIPVDHPALPDDVNTVMDELANIMTNKDTLLFYVTDHGGHYGTSGAESSSDTAGLDEFICLWNKKGYYDDWLKAKFDAIKCKNSILIMDLCHSGGYTWDLSRTDRIIMTASTEEQGSFDHPDHPNGDFTYNLFNAFDGKWYVPADQDYNGRISVAEAFNYAAVASIPAQTPTYDDNGDGISHFKDIANGGPVEDEGRLGNTYL
jgi:hypothetical protein